MDGDLAKFANAFSLAYRTRARMFAVATGRRNGREEQLHHAMTATELTTNAMPFNQNKVRGECTSTPDRMGCYPGSCYACRCLERIIHAL